MVEEEVFDFSLKNVTMALYGFCFLTHDLAKAVAPWLAITWFLRHW